MCGKCQIFFSEGWFMFVGNIDNIDKDGGDFHPVIYAVLEYLRVTDFKNILDGDYPMPHTDFIVKVQRYQTRSIEDCYPEAHKKFIDVQFVTEGEEVLGWCPLSPDLKIIKPYNEKTDVTFYESLLPESSVMLADRNYAVLFPLDVHRPCGSLDDDCPSQVTKVVVKIPVKLVLEDDTFSISANQ